MNERDEFLMNRDFAIENYFSTSQPPLMSKLFPSSPIVRQEANAAIASGTASVSDDPQNPSPSPPLLAPQSYVQQLASTLGLRTDFESLIELNRRPPEPARRQQLNMTNVRQRKYSKQLKCLN